MKIIIHDRFSKSLYSFLKGHTYTHDILGVVHSKIHPYDQQKLMPGRRSLRMQRLNVQFAFLEGKDRTHKGVRFKRWKHR